MIKAPSHLFPGHFSASASASALWTRRSLLGLLLAGAAGTRLGAQEKDAADSTEAAASALAQAREVTTYIQEHFYQRRSGLYQTAIDNERPDYIWGCGVMFSALVSAARHEEKDWRPLMGRFFTAMDRYWDDKVKIPARQRPRRAMATTNIMTTMRGWC